MAYTNRDFWHAETGGLEDCDATSGSPSADSTIKQSGSYSFKLPSNTASSIDFDYTGTSERWVSVWSRFSDATPAADKTFLEIWDPTDTDLHASLVLKTDGKIEIVDATGSTAASSGAVFSNNTWHFVQFHFVASDSSSGEVWVDHNQEAILSGDYRDGTSSPGFIRLRNAGSNHTDMWFDTLRLDTGTTSERPTGGEALSFLGDSSSTTSGDALDAGNLYDTQEIPVNETNIADQTGAGGYGSDIDCDGTGGATGPAGQGLNTFDNMKVICRGKRSGGSGTAQYLRYGNDVDGAVNSSDLNATTGFANYRRKLGHAHIRIPSNSEYMRVGMGKSAGGQDWDVAEMLGFLLHVPAEPGGSFVRPYMQRKNIRHMVNR